MPGVQVLLRMGYPPKKAFFWGQMTGVVQPLAGVLGAAAVLAVKPLLPFALSFAACAMLFVIVRDMVRAVLIATWVVQLKVPSVLGP